MPARVDDAASISDERRLRTVDRSSTIRTGHSQRDRRASLQAGHGDRNRLGDANHVASTEHARPHDAILAAGRR